MVSKQQAVMNPRLQMVLSLGLSIIVFAMCLAYKTPSQVWRGIHDTLVYKNSVVEILSAVLALSVVAAILLKRSVVLPNDKLSVALCVLVSFAALSFFWSDRPGFATHKALMWACGLFVFFATRQVTSNDRALHVVLNAVFFATVLVAIIGLMQTYFAYKGVPQATPPASTFSNKNMANHPIILSFGLGVYFLFKDVNRSLFLDVLYAVSIAILLAFVFHTKTRAAWLGLAVEGLILLVCALWVWKVSGSTGAMLTKRRNMVVGIGALCLLLMMSFQHDSKTGQLAFHNPVNVLSGVAENTANQLSPTSDKGSFETRKKIWSGTWGVIKTAPLLGVGMGNFYAAYPEHYLFNNESIRRAHNDYLEMLAEIGVLGFVMFLICVVLVLRMLMTLLSKSVQPENRLLAMCITAMFAGTAVNAVFSFPYYHITPMILMGIYVGVISGRHAMLLTTSGSASQRVISITSEKKSTALLVLVLAVFAFVALRAALYVEGMERQWTQQLNEHKWQHIKLNEPRWLETTHYSPVLQGIYGALISERDRYDALAKKEMSFKKRVDYRDSRNTLDQLANDVATNSNQYTPQLYFLMSMAQEARQNGAYAEARTHLDQALNLMGKGNVNGHIAITSLIKHTDGESAAVEYLKGVQSTISPEFMAYNEMSYMSLGSAFFELNAMDQALAAFKQGLEVFPDTLVYLESIIRLLHSNSQHSVSVPYMEQYIAHPNANIEMLEYVTAELSKQSSLTTE